MLNRRFIRKAIGIFGVALSMVPLSAEVPQSASIKDYMHILTKKPFAPLEQKVVQKPTAAKVAPPRVDWTLKGATKMADGWLVVISNKKTPRENVILRENQSSEGMPTIVSVTQDKLNYRNSSVKVKTPDGKEQVVVFDMAALKTVQAKSKAPEPSKIAKPPEVKKVTLSSERDKVVPRRTITPRRLIRKDQTK